jgi:MGT family glycosyltransferase
MTKLTYLVALVDGGGTVPVELGIVRRLVERGHDVTVLAEDSMADDVQASGATFRRWVEAPNRPDRLPENDPYRDWECKSPRQLFARLLERQFAGPLRRYAVDVDVAIAARRPDVVLCAQFAFGAMVAAEAAGIPFDVLMPNVYLLPTEGATPFGLGLRPARGAAGRARDRFVRSMTHRMWDKGLQTLNMMRAEHGLEPLDHFMDQPTRARRLWVLTSTEFEFPTDLPANVRYAGPVLDDPNWATDDWTPPPGDDPLVLVGLSSTYQDHVATLQRIVDALATLAVRAIVTTGPALDAGSIAGAPNVVVVPSAPHGRVLEHAAVVVTHGGHGTVVKALAAGVPLVVLPHGRDQLDNAVRVTSRGAGVKLKRTATAAQIAGAVSTVLANPAYRESATLLGAAIRRDAERSALFDELDALPANV